MTAPGQILLQAFPDSLCPVSPIGVSAVYLPPTLYNEDAIDWSNLEVFCKETGQLLEYELLDAVTLDGNSRWRESEGTHQVLVRVKAECLPPQIGDLTAEVQE